MRRLPWLNLLLPLLLFVPLAAQAQEVSAADSMTQLRERIQELEAQIREVHVEAPDAQAVPNDIGARGEAFSEAVGAELKATVDELREEREDLRRELREALVEARRDRSRSHSGGYFSSLFSGMRNILGEGVALGLFLILGLVTAQSRMVHKARRVAREDMGKVVAVGIAGAFLAPPVFVIGIIALALSIIGIPLIPIWIVGVPAIIGLSALLGFLAFSKVLGEKVAEHWPYVEWLQSETGHMAAGLGLFFGTAAAGHALSVLGGIGAGVGGLVAGISGLALLVASMAGFGVMLVTYADHRRERRDRQTESMEAEDMLS